MNLVWSHIVLENLAEDLAGALDRGQWQVAGIAVRRLLQVGLRAVYSALGMAPLPADAELAAMLPTVPGIPAELAETAARLRVLADGGQREGSPAEAIAGFLDQVRRLTGGEDFPSSFASATAWRRTLDIGYDWLRLGVYLKAPLPLEEAADLLAGAGTVGSAKDGPL
jgi:hypothetical protein